MVLPSRLSSAIRLALADILTLCFPLGSSSMHRGRGQFRHDGNMAHPSSRQPTSSGNKSPPNASCDFRLFIAQLEGLIVN